MLSEDEQQDVDNLDPNGRPYPTLAGSSEEDTDDERLVIDEDAASAGPSSSSAQVDGAMAMELGGS